MTVDWVTPANESVAISTIVTLGPQLFIAINSELNVWLTPTGVHDWSGGIPTISGGIVHDEVLTTWTRNWTGIELNGVVLVELIKSST
jgi:hypothetical protein